MLTYLTTGESHGPQLTAVIDGLPAGLAIDSDQIQYHLARRQKGYGRGGRMLIENDRARFVSGVRHGKTTGAPITMVIENKDWPNWAEIMDPLRPLPESLDLKTERLASHTSKPRPGHADLPGGVKWDHHDLRNVLERASARETAARVALGALVRQLLEQFSVRFACHVIRIGPETVAGTIDRSDLERLSRLAEASDVRCIDPATETRMIAAIREAKKKRDSLGGIAEIIVSGLPIGLGGCSQWRDRLDGQLAGALMAVQSAKGVEIGLGFSSTEMRGSKVHDQIYYKAGSDPARKDFYRKTNNAGGLEGGMTNGEDIVIRIGCKPISTLNQPLDTVDVNTKDAEKAMVERTDNCVVPAFAVVCEAVAVLVLAEAFLKKFGSDNMAEIRRNYDNFLSTEY